MTEKKIRGTRPHIWITGPDELRHEKYKIYTQQKNQAQWRKEGWDISFDDWLVFWENGNWERRGREPHNLSMTRIDRNKHWTIDNVEIVCRREILKRNQEIKKIEKKTKDKSD